MNLARSGARDSLLETSRTGRKLPERYSALARPAASWPRVGRDVATTAGRTQRNFKKDPRCWAKNLKTLSQMAGKSTIGTRNSGKTLYTSTLFSSFKKGAHPGKFRASPAPGEIEPDPAPNRWHRCRRWQRSCWLRGHSCGLRTHSCGLRKPACWLRKHSCWLRGQPCRLRKHSSWLRETGRAGRAGRLRRDPLENTPEFQNLAAVVG